VTPEPKELGEVLTDLHNKLGQLRDMLGGDAAQQASRSNPIGGLAQYCERLPERGVNVTVYGIPWNAMLTFGAAAGPVRNKAELKRRYDGGIGAARGGGGECEAD